MLGNAQPSLIDALLKHNAEFVALRSTNEERLTSKPKKQLAVISCIDTRLTRLLPQSLGLVDGDAVFIKVAGPRILDSYGDVMRSLLIAVAKLDVREVIVVGHTDCGTCEMQPQEVLNALEGAGSDPCHISSARENSEVTACLTGFDSLEQEVREALQAIREHNLLPDSLKLHGLIIDVYTAELKVVESCEG